MVAASQHEDLILGLIQAKQSPVFPLPYRGDVDIEVSTDFAFVGLVAVLNGRGHEMEARLVIQPGERVDLRPHQCGLSMKRESKRHDQDGG